MSGNSPATEQVEAPKTEVPVAQAAEPKVETKTEVPAPKATPEGAWKDDRIAKLTAKLAEARSALQTREAENANLRAGKTSVGLPPEEVDRRANALADQKVAFQRFSDQCAKAAADGREKYGKEFDERLGTILQVAGRSPTGAWIDEESADRYNAFVAAAIETGAPHVVLHEIGKSQDEVSRILNMPLTRQVAELTRLAIKASEPEPVSTLPKPIAPVGRAGSSVTNNDPSDPAQAGEMDINTWMQRRNAQTEANGASTDRRRLAG
jgi:hypothetical protein